MFRIVIDTGLMFDCIVLSHQIWLDFDASKMHHFYKLILSN